MSGLRYSYVTNGLTDHRLDEALRMLADCGYAGVGLTLDHHHLDPFAADVAERVATVARLTQQLGLAVVVETGGRFVLDPRRKHQPTMMSTDGRERRIAFLQHAVRVAADLGAEAVSFWSGTATDDVDEQRAWDRVIDGCRSVLEVAHEHNIPLAFEPEPGMFVESVSDWKQLANRLSDPLFGITLDIGHCLCTEDKSIADVIRDVADRLRYVQIEDMKKGVHEHLNFGDGDVDFPPALAALNEIGFKGLVSVELSRHSHTAHTTVPNAIEFLRSAEQASPDGKWVVDAVAAIRNDPSSIRRLFPAVARNTGVGQDRARMQLITALGNHRAVELPDLYRFGDANERRAILLSAQDHVDDVLLGLARDALRSNDPRLIVAASQAAIVGHFSDDEVDQVLMKCVFMDIQLEQVPALVQRAGPATARMLAAFVLERVTAGRDVPADIWDVIRETDSIDEIHQVEALVDSPIPAQREAAKTTLAARMTRHERTQR